jgi:hypothetical protein
VLADVYPTSMYTERSTNIDTCKKMLGPKNCNNCYSYLMHPAVAQWLRYCATNRKVAGSIPDGVTGIFH